MNGFDGDIARRPGGLSVKAVLRKDGSLSLPIPDELAPEVAFVWSTMLKNFASEGKVRIVIGRDGEVLYQKTGCSAGS